MTRNGFPKRKNLHYMKKLLEKRRVFNEETNISKPLHYDFFVNMQLVRHVASDEPSSSALNPS